MRRVGPNFNHHSAPRCPVCEANVEVTITGPEERTRKGGPFGLPVRCKVCAHEWVTTCKALMLSEWKKRERVAS